MSSARKEGEGSFRELLSVAYPLVISTASGTVMQFVNRLFLAHYSPEAMAACVPGGILSFTFLSFFMGLASYTNAFVAQYFGSGNREKISESVWQGIWLAVFSWLFMLLSIPLGLLIINSAGHDPAVSVLERQYFTVLTVPSLFSLLACPLAAFYTGRGRTLIVMAANIAGNAVCVLMSWWLIFGGFGIGPLGISGAGIASGFGQFFIFLILLFAVFSARNRKMYNISGLWKFNGSLFFRLVRFAIPSGFGTFIDVAAYGAFIFLIGSIDKYSLAASNIVVSIDSIAFMPVLGIGMAALTLVGKYMGAGKTEVAEAAAYKAVLVSMTYATCVAFLFYFFPSFFVNIFGSGNNEEYAVILPLARRLMHILAFAILLDGTGIVFADALRGAGDTLFQMVSTVVMAVFIYMPLVWFSVYRLHSVVTAWWVYCGYIAVYFICFMLRFRAGAWKKIVLVRS